MTKEEEEKARKDAEEKSRADADGKMQAILDGISAISGACDSMKTEMDAMKGRMDAFEKGDPAKAAADKKDAEEKEAKEKADAEEKERKDAEEKAEKEKADAEEKAKADAAAAGDVVAGLSRQIAALDAAIKPRADADSNTIATSWTKANAVMVALGDSAGASMALPGEATSAYRRRIIAPLQPHSNRWSKVDLATLSGATFDIAEEQIRADAMDAAMSPLSTINAGGLREIRNSHSSGHTIVTWAGQPKGWMDSFAGSGQRAAGEFKTRQGVH